MPDDTYIYRSPRKGQTQKFSAKNVTINHSFPIPRPWAKFPSKLSSKFSTRSESTPKVHEMSATPDPAPTYIIQGDLLYIHIRFTLAFHLWSCWMQALSSKFKLTRGDLLYIIG